MKVSRKGEHSTPGALYHHVHAKWFLLWCVSVSNACFNLRQSRIAHDRGTLHGCMATMYGNHLRVIWNVHMMFFHGIHGNGKSQQCASLCCTRSTSTIYRHPNQCKVVYIGPPTEEEGWLSRMSGGSALFTDAIGWICTEVQNLYRIRGFKPNIFRLGPIC